MTPHPTCHDIIILEGGPLHGERVKLPGLEPGEEYQARQMMPNENASYQPTGRFENYVREHWDSYRRRGQRGRREDLLIPVYQWAGWVAAESSTP